MDSIVIPTRPHLPDFTGQKFHLVLSHELTPTSKAFYQRESEHGSFLTLDNSAHEKQSGEDLDVLLRQAHEIGASEVVVPDVLFDGVETLYRFRTGLLRLAQSGQTEVPRLMIVPQGSTKEILSHCLWEMLSFVNDLHRRYPHTRKWGFTIGVSKDYNDYWGDKDFLLFFLDDVVVPASRILNAEIHLLGWPKPLPVLKEISKNFFYNIRSTDSARPITFAMFGIDLTKSLEVPYPRRPAGFFDRKVPNEFSGILRKNISVYRRLTRGIEIIPTYEHAPDSGVI